MEIVDPVYWPHYFTATIQGWKQLLSTERFKNIIIDSLKTMVQEMCPSGVFANVLLSLTSFFSETPMLQTVAAVGRCKRLVSNQRF